MLVVKPELGYARLEVVRDQDFTEVAEAIRTLFHACCLNNHLGALIVSSQSGVDWRSCVRLAIRIAANKAVLPKSKLALVITPNNNQLRKDVTNAADEAGLACNVFDDEADAIAWLGGSGHS